MYIQESFVAALALAGTALAAPKPYVQPVAMVRLIANNASEASKDYGLPCEAVAESGLAQL